MTTLDYLVNEVTSRALSGMREEISPLGADMDTNTDIVSLPPGIPRRSMEAGATLQIGYELMRINSTPTPDQLQVARAILNSVIAPHSAGDDVIVNPRFPAVDVVSAINQDIDDLSAPTNGLFNMRTTVFIYNPAIIGYDFGIPASEILEAWEVRAADYGAQRSWPLIVPSQWKLDRGADPNVFPSGVSMKIYGGAFPGRPIRVQYKAPYDTPLIDPTDDVELTTGLQPQAHDIPVLGATYRLMQFRELKRSFTEAQGEPRRAAEVPVGSSLTAMKGIQAHRTDRIAAERERLNKTWARARR
jgi:hypothetical protein